MSLKSANHKRVGVKTTIYEVEVKAKNEDDAEAKAYKKFAEGDYIDEKVVYVGCVVCCLSL